MAETGSDGGANPMEPHQSQCEPACGTSLEPASELLAETALALQRPPSLPVRTSSASKDTGATNADSTARKPNQAAKRAHTDSGGREDGRWNTARL